MSLSISIYIYICFLNYVRPEPQVKFTAVLLPSGNVARTTSSPAPSAASECKLEDEALVALLATEIATKKKKKNTKKKPSADKAE